MNIHEHVNTQVLRAYNAVARAEVEHSLHVHAESKHGQGPAKHAGIYFLDMFDMVFPLFDLSYDEAHYQGPVGRALALRLVQHLASTAPLPPPRSRNSIGGGEGGGGGGGGFISGLKKKKRHSFLLLLPNSSSTLG